MFVLWCLMTTKHEVGESRELLLLLLGARVPLVQQNTNI